MLSRRRALATTAIAVLCGACAGERGPSGGVEDDAGRTVRLARPAERIVSLSPATTELLFHLGVGDRVVGRTRWDQDPPEARSVPSVGDGLDPNVEAIVARRPDLVVFYHSPANDAAIERLAALGVAAVSLKQDQLADLERATLLVGRLVGDTVTAHRSIRQLRQALDTVAVKRSLAERPRVLMVAWDNPPIVIGAASFLSEIVELAGGRNAFGDIDRPSAQVSIEAIADRRPDVVLVAAGTTAGSLMGRPEWQVVDAIRANRVVQVDGTEFAHPSFRAPRAVRELRDALDLFTR